MTINNKRKKQPEIVRATLLRCAKTLAVRSGLSAISVQAVCDQAGVTKGAFFHHFENKDALLKCVFEQMITDYSEEIGRLISADPWTCPAEESRLPRARSTRSRSVVGQNGGSDFCRNGA